VRVVEVEQRSKLGDGRICEGEGSFVLVIAQAMGRDVATGAEKIAMLKAGP
jgi:hypothetical protein